LQHLEAGADCAIEDGHVTKLSLPGQGLRFCQNFDPNPKYSRELSPADLSEFKNLREVTLWGGTIQKYDPLLEFTKLQKVLVSGLNNHQLGVLAKLKQKGVEVVLR
ncbi:MAG: hypothetical protein KDD56_07370, partial [Bdellovibrionales bacterium]|nr:hypothetical protein [Bdellovibrionales bacterium]